MCFGKKKKPPPNSREGGVNQREYGPRVVRSSVRSRASLSSENRNTEGRPENGGPGTADNGRKDPRTQGSPVSANRKAESQQDGDGGGLEVAHDRSTRTRRNLSLKNRTALSQPEGDEMRMAPSSSNNTHTQKSSSPTNTNAEGQPEDERPGVAPSGRRGTHAQESPDSANRNSESQSGGDRWGMAASGGHITRTGKNFSQTNRNAATQHEDDEPRTAPGSDNNMHTQKSPSRADGNAESQRRNDGPGMAASRSNSTHTQESSSPRSRNAEGQPEDLGPGAGVSGRKDASTQGSPDSANRNPMSQPEDNELQITPGSSNNTYTQKSPSAANRNAEGQPGDDVPEMVANDNHNTHSQKNSSPANRNAKGQPEGDGPAMTTGSHDNAHTRKNSGLGNRNGNSQQEGEEPGIVDRKLIPYSSRGPASEGPSPTRSQSLGEAQDTFDHRVGYGMGEGSQSTRDTSTIDTSIEYRNTQGKFDSNSGGYNNYGDENSKIVNDGTLVNEEAATNFMRADGEEEFKSIATATRGEELHVPWMVPYCQNRGFKGRGDILNKVKAKTEVKGHNRIGLWGLGGTGKTQIALEYVYQYKGRRPVFWVHGSSLKKFSEEFNNIGISQATIGGEDDNALTLVKQWFEGPNSGEWILVVDNADNERDFENNSSPIAQYIPRGPKGTLIITTRSRQVASRLGCHGETAIEVPRMGPEEAKQLFLSHYEASSHPGHEKAVEDILGSLHYLPLALVGAAAYMTETYTSPSNYLGMLKSEDVREKLLSQEFDDIYREAPTGVAESILSIFFTTFEQITKEHHDAANILRLITFMKDHQNIPEDAIRRSGLEGVDDELTARNAIRKLVDFSLVTKTSSLVKGLPVYELHRLVQNSAEAYFKKHERRDVSIWMDRAQKVETFVSPSHWSSAASSQQPPEPHGMGRQGGSQQPSTT